MTHLRYLWFVLRQAFAAVLPIGPAVSDSDDEPFVICSGVGRPPNARDTPPGS